MTGNFFCIPNTCSRVSYQVYEAGGIRYRYSGDDWILVDGDAYTIETTERDCQHINLLPRVKLTVTVRHPNTGQVSQLQNQIFSGIPDSDYLNFSFAGDAVTVNFIGSDPVVRTYTAGFNIPYIVESVEYIKTDYFFVTNNPDGSYSVGSSPLRSFELDYLCTPSTCILNIFKEGELVFSNTNSDCPEVEEVDCQLSETYQEIIVEKLAYLQRVEVRDQLIELVYLNVGLTSVPLIETSPLPENYLAIYKTLVVAPPVLSEYVPQPGVIFPWELIAVINSADGCPPPEYNVYCDCDCESCPDGTCAVECGEHICCYDSTGQSQASIPIENYCDES